MPKVRFTVPDQEWDQVLSLGRDMGLEYRDVAVMCLGIGLQYLRLALHPPKDLVAAVAGSPVTKRMVKARVDEALRPVESQLKRAKRKQSNK